MNKCGTGAAGRLGAHFPGRLGAHFRAAARVDPCRGAIPDYSALFRSTLLYYPKSQNFTLEPQIQLRHLNDYRQEQEPIHIGYDKRVSNQTGWANTDEKGDY